MELWGETVGELLGSWLSLVHIGGNRGTLMGIGGYWWRFVDIGGIGRKWWEVGRIRGISVI